MKKWGDVSVIVIMILCCIAGLTYGIYKMNMDIIIIAFVLGLVLSVLLTESIKYKRRYE